MPSMPPLAPELVPAVRPSGKTTGSASAARCSPPWAARWRRRPPRERPLPVRGGEGPGKPPSASGHPRFVGLGCPRRREDGQVTESPQGWGWMGNHLVQLLAVNNPELGDSRTSVKSLCCSSRHTPNLGSFAMQKTHFLTVTPQPAGQSPGQHAESGPGQGGPFLKALGCFAVPGDRNRMLLISRGWFLMKPCPQSPAHGVMRRHGRLVISMAVWSCRKNIFPFCSFRKITPTNQTKKTPKLDSAKDQNNVNNESSIFIKEGIKPGSLKFSSGYTADLWTRNYKVRNSRELLKPTGEN